MAIIYYFPENQFIFRNCKPDPGAQTTIVLRDDDNSKQKITFRSGINEISEELASEIKKNPIFDSYFNEGSLVWEQRVPQHKKEKPSDSLLEPIETVIASIEAIGTKEELEKIIKSDKRPEVVEAIKNKLAEINKAAK